LTNLLLKYPGSFNRPFWIAVSVIVQEHPKLAHGSPAALARDGILQ
jgi:hypothetical protein